MSSAALQPPEPLPPALLMMQRETRIAYGAVPRRLFGEPLPETTWQLREDEFLLRGEGDH